MGFLSRIKSQYGPAHPFWYTDPASGFVYGGPTASGTYVTADTAMRATAVARCVRLISGIVARVPLKVYRALENDGREQARQHPLWRTLHDRPNDQQTSFEFREQMQAALLLRGNAYARIVPGARGAVAGQLLPLHPDCVTPRPKGYLGRSTVSYEYRVPDTMQTETYLQEEVFHLRSMPSWRAGLVGLNPIEYHRETIGLAMAEEEYGARMFSNGAQFSGVLEHPNQLKPAARKNIEDSIAERHTGLRNQWRVFIAEEGMKWKQMSMRARDAQYLESRQFQIAEIARIFGVPPHMIADVAGSTSWGTGIEQQVIGFVTMTISYWLGLWEQAIARDLILEDDPHFAEFVIEGLLRGDIKTRYEAYSIAINTGFMSRNEVRVKESMNQEEGLDEFLQPLNMGGADRVSDVPSPNQPSGPTEAPQERAFRLFRALIPVRPKKAERQPAGKLERFVRSAAERLAGKELAAVRKATEKFAGEAMTEWADGFYAGFAADVVELLHVPFEVAEAFALAAKGALLAADDRPELLREWSVKRADDLAELALGLEETTCA